MSIGERVGQLLMVGIPGPDLDEHTRGTLSSLEPAGVILFQRNFRDLRTLVQLGRDIRNVVPARPPLIAIDHEGGRVDRLNAPFTHFPPAALLGRCRSGVLAYEVGVAMGKELRSAGIDLDFAPVLDVLTNPANTLIGDRALSDDPRLVAELGCAWAKGLRDAGVIPCAKHFPGHGATLLDSHTDLPRDERDAGTLASIDLAPFRRAIREGIEITMLAHVVYPAFDPVQPASLSPTIIGPLLRDQLGFQGVTVTDDLDMGAIINNGSVADAAVSALQAGADLVLVCQNLDNARAARDACVRAVHAGALSEARVGEALARLQRLRDRFSGTPPPPPACIGAPEHLELAARIQAAAT